MTFAFLGYLYKYTAYNMTEVDYIALNKYCMINGAKYGLSKMDCEDVLHDTCVHILENSIPPEDYRWCAVKFMGKFREKRNRESGRQISTTYFEKKGEL